MARHGRFRELPLCAACGDPRVEHSEQERRDGCRRNARSSRCILCGEMTERRYASEALGRSVPVCGGCLRQPGAWGDVA